MPAPLGGRGDPNADLWRTWRLGGACFAIAGWILLMFGALLAASGDRTGVAMARWGTPFALFGTIFYVTYAWRLRSLRPPRPPRYQEARYE